MLYLVVSTPHPAKPEDIKDIRSKWWPWTEALKARDKVISHYARVGSGAVIIFDVSSNTELHDLLTQWSNIVPVTFDIYPLVAPEEAQRFLKA